MLRFLDSEIMLGMLCNLNIITQYLPTTYHQSYTNFTILIVKQNNFKIVGSHKKQGHKDMLYIAFLITMHFTLMTIDL